MQPPATPFGLVLALALAGLIAGCSERAPELPRHEGSRQMAAILAERIAAAEASETTFSPERRIEILRSIPPPADPRARFEIALELADAELRAGETRQAAAQVEQLEGDAQKLAESLPVVLRQRFDRLAGIVWLRLAELDNCLEGHNADSCLLPLSGGGIHRRQEGARRAFAVYGRILEAQPQDLEARWLLNLAAMTVGEYPQSVPAAWQIPPQALSGEEALPRFFDVAERAGVAILGLSGGVVSEDLDGDLDLDLMVSSWGLHDPLRVFLNEQGFFRELSTAESGLLGIVGGLNLLHADYDNDGDVDILVLRGAWMGENGLFPPSLLRNRGNGTFDDVTLEAGLLSFSPTQTAAWADFDRDGWLDLYFGAETTGASSLPCRLMRNRGDGTFEERSAGSGAAVVGFVKAVVAADFDNDSWPDLYISRLGGTNLLLRNRGELHFEDVTRAAGVEEPRSSFPVVVFDYDQDGWLDIFVSGFALSYTHAGVAGVAADYLGLPRSDETPRLYHNRGDGSFEDVTAKTGLNRVMLSMGANFGDFDNDGFPDLYLGTGAPDFQALLPNLALHNVPQVQGGRRFVDATAATGMGHLQKGHGIAFADFDQDFDQDIYAVLGGAYSGDVYWNALFENPGMPGHHGITLKLEGKPSNASALGARLRLELEDGRQVFATVGTGGSFGSSSLQQELGLGAATRVKTLEVQWPSGEVQRFSDLQAESFYLLREGESAPRKIERQQFSLGASAATPAHVHPRP